MAEATASKRMSVFDRYLTVWVFLCMVLGVLLGRAVPQSIGSIRDVEIVAGSQINLPIAVLIWLMITPMMMRIQFSSLASVGRRPKGLLVTLLVNWIVKPLSMAALGWLFFQGLFLPLIGEELAKQYTAGVIILAAAPCTAMVFVWSYLTDGDPAYTLVQVALNDLIMLVLFVPMVSWLVGATGLVVPMPVLVTSVVVFIVVPLALGVLLRTVLIRRLGEVAFQERILPRFQPIAVSALLAMLVMIFAFQAENLLNHPLHVLLIAIPIILQVLLNSGLAYGLMAWLRVPGAIAAPGALIGASNFFELAVATAIALYGPESGAALATTVGVLVEVPMMLLVCTACNRTRGWIDRRAMA
ncbi:ACR3 family arsenite efflux transporter [Tuwongella immobilis]|uniref:Arsenical-resistance protein n=1 Tax=Tuwongella immobilis TaxID=692036 RepID=A0A6C2YLX5_9BACT|nr:ACR3 family arsenite efflux transporter [Tuwongella immobilis]VIP01922.1 arsenic transporter : Arsenical-resistance protein OS=Isosphaera pallida (strain ATCC 43644 / DSM 9630 / IS1B) GN=Isop_2571 PE=4 SV=1: SBF [Tuwongella immobilis]VTR99854.1 arsenic transporter : Arsenical-resistance protein OS=Isosphaera pallida (strain ATCC 43644 / DSM 9630 / IS1B) GN=Isop_2571 PE=4 SV=1: SBF [Tuwongella immobilis]